MAISMKDAYRVMFKEFPDVVDVDQMSRMLGISTKTGYRLLQENKIITLCKRCQLERHSGMAGA